jgi:hypothetical protein
MLLVVAGNDRAVRFYERQGLHVAELVDGLAYYHDRMGVVFPADTASFRLLGLVQNPRGCLPRSQRRQGLSPSRDRPAARRLRACPGSAAAGPGRSATTARPRPSRPRQPAPGSPWTSPSVCHGVAGPARPEGSTNHPGRSSVAVLSTTHVFIFAGMSARPRMGGSGSRLRRERRAEE